MAKRKKTSGKNGSGKPRGRPRKNANQDAQQIETGSEAEAEAGTETGKEGARVVGLVNVDQAALASELDSISPPAQAADVAGDAPTIDTEAAARENELAQAKAQEAAPAVKMMLRQGADIFAPNWEITDDEINRLGDSTALVMAYWIPDDMLPPKYMALVGLAMVGGSIAAARRGEDGAFKPLRKPKPEAQPIQAAA